jgi:dTDP-4-amino-4,6-dideoxygalactose transaminase
VSIFSFGRDKIISSVNGGVLVINTPHETHEEWHKNITLETVSRVVVIKNLLYAILGYLASVSYDFFRFGKVLYWVSGTLKLFPEIVSKKEKHCVYTDLSFGLPPVLAQLARAELASLDQCNAIRRNTAMKYNQKL